MFNIVSWFLFAFKVPRLWKDGTGSPQKGTVDQLYPYVPLAKYAIFFIHDGDPTQRYEEFWGVITKLTQQNTVQSNI